MKELLFTSESKVIIDFILSVIFALLIGIELNNRLQKEGRANSFGTDRTFTFISILGYILYTISPTSLAPYLVGFSVLGILLTSYYILRVRAESRYGMTAVILALLIYALPVFIITQPRWFSLLVIVILMTFSEIKPQLKAFSTKIFGDEFLTLSKFLVITGVILPLVPDREFVPFVPVSPHKLWLAIVVISSISYASYVVRKYIFPNAGLMLSGILGGLYSSTATVFILARKSKVVAGDRYEYAAAIIAANTMMFLRIWIITLFFNRDVAEMTAPIFLALYTIGTVISLVFYRKKHIDSAPIPPVEVIEKNPLELWVALLFALLYVVFSVITSYTISTFGSEGLHILSYVVGFSDINPFVISLFQTHSALTVSMLAIATINAVAGNTLLNGVYATVMSSKDVKKPLMIGYGLLTATLLTMSVILFLS